VCDPSAVLTAASTAKRRADLAALRNRLEQRQNMDAKLRNRLANRIKAAEKQVKEVVEEATNPTKQHDDPVLPVPDPTTDSDEIVQQAIDDIATTIASLEPSSDEKIAPEVEPDPSKVLSAGNAAHKRAELKQLRARLEQRSKMDSKLKNRLMHKMKKTEDQLTAVRIVEANFEKEKQSRLQEIENANMGAQMKLKMEQAKRMREFEAQLTAELKAEEAKAMKELDEVFVHAVTSSVANDKREFEQVMEEQGMALAQEDATKMLADHHAKEQALKQAILGERATQKAALKKRIAQSKKLKAEKMARQQALERQELEEKKQPVRDRGRACDAA
jgi:hypothetical protein